jgi:preprotein translocase SecE subunit
VVHQRPVTIAFIIAALAAAALVRTLVQALLPALGSEDLLLAGAVAGSTALGLVAGGITFFVLMRHERARAFADSVVDELVQVTWPTRDETVANTGIVVGAAVFFAALLAVYDLVWARISELVLYSTG